MTGDSTDTATQSTHFIMPGQQSSDDSDRHPSSILMFLFITSDVTETVIKF